MTSHDPWRRLEEVFQGALDIPEEDRDAWLNTACEGDSQLRQDVESLLERDSEDSPKISGIIEGVAASLFDDPQPEAPPPDAMAGMQLGNYRIIRELGRGGMGAVYLAVRADRAFDKQVAIKLVKRGIDTDAVLQRFWYERRILAALDHPYIAHLLDGGTSPDGRPYFVMEYVDGRPLDVYAGEQNLTIEQRCELLRKVCEAVSYAHRNLVIHRDLKPANILVTGDGTPKLLDFGIARLLSMEPGQSTFAGPVSAHALTPEFASPEQMRGDAVTTATDVYSLGATMKAILPAGRRPAPDLAAIIHKALSEETDRRYASVADLSDDLHCYLTGLPIRARHQTLLYQAGKFVRRHRMGVAAFLIAGILAVAAIAAIVWESRNARIERKQAEQRLSQAVEMAERALADVNNSMASLPGATEARRQMVRSTLDYLDRLNKDSGGDARVLTALATAYVRVGEVLGNADFPNLGDLPGSLATYQKALGLIKDLAARYPEDLKIRDLAAVAHQGAGTVLESMGRNKEAVAEDRAAIALADSTLAITPDRTESQERSLDAHFALAMIRYVTDPEGTQQDVRKQLPLARKMADAHPDDLGMQETLSEYYAMSGTTANRLNRLQESLDYYRRAAEVREAIYRRNPRNTKYQRSLMIGYGHVGDVLGSPFTGCLGDYRGALEYYRKAESIAEEMNRADPSDHRARFDMGMIWTRIGATQRANGDLRSSNWSLQLAISYFDPIVGSSPGNATYARGIALTYEYLGRNAWDLGDRASAMAWYRKSQSIADKLLAHESTDPNALVQRVAVLGPIASLLALSGDRSGAIRTANQAITEAQDNLARGGTAHSVAMAWLWYARTHEALNDCKAAASAYQKSVEAWRKTASGLTGTFAVEMREAQRKETACAPSIRPQLTPR